MPNKAQAYVEMADKTARKITGDYLEWAAFLTASSRLYKYPFHDQLMIYAQRPDATACATYELWNDIMRRYIRRGGQRGSRCSHPALTVWMFGMSLMSLIRAQGGTPGT